jgi:uncharacterized protein
MTETSHSSSNQPAWIAFFGVVISIVLHVILDAEKPFFPFIIGCCLTWVIYISVNIIRNPSIACEWGFRLDNLGIASRWPFVFMVIGIVSMSIFGAIQGTLRLPIHLPLLLLLYPLWGIIQQFLALGIVVSSLEKIPWLHDKRILIVLLTGGLFALVHINDWRVMLATFALELAFVPMYWQHRNLIPIAIVHGWLGAFYYLWVLDVDLWVETFGS